MADFNLADLFAPSLQIGATILSAGSQYARGQAGITIAAERQAADAFEARQLEQEAEQSRGVGMRAAQDQTINMEMINSTALARAAASGAGGSDPTVMAVIARTAGAGAYRAQLANFEGEAQARFDLMKASALTYEGKIGVAGAASAATMADIGAGATLLAGAARGASLYDRFYSGPRPSVATTMPQISGGDTQISGGWQDAGSQSSNAA